jgi:competence protein ComEA
VVLARLVAIVRWWGIGRTLGAVSASVLVCAVVYWAVRVEPPAVESSIPSAVSSSLAPSVVAITVHVGGEVVNPGVYSLPPGARVVDAVTAAGGVTAKAELDAINLAAPLVDAIQVLVPRKGVSPRRQPSGVASPVGPSGSLLVNINTASLTELDALPGVGPSTAKAIVDTREKKGSFASVDDLLDVPGIGPAKLAQIRDLVTW